MNPLYAVLSGIGFRDTAGVGTFYDFKFRKLLLDFAHEVMPYYEYCRRIEIIPFINLNRKCGIKLPYKNDFTISKDGVPVCREG